MQLTFRLFMTFGKWPLYPFLEFHYVFLFYFIYFCFLFRNFFCFCALSLFSPCFSLPIWAARQQEKKQQQKVVSLYVQLHCGKMRRVHSIYLSIMPAFQPICRSFHGVVISIVPVTQTLYDAVPMKSRNSPMLLTPHIISIQQPRVL